MCGRGVCDSSLPLLIFLYPYHKNAEVVCFINFQSIISVSVLISVLKGFIYQNNRNVYESNNKRMNYEVSIHLIQLYFRLRQNICSYPKINLSTFIFVLLTWYTNIYIYYEAACLVFFICHYKIGFKTENLKVGIQ